MSEAVTALLCFLPVLEAPGFAPGEWRGGDTDENGVIQMPWFELGPEATAFMQELGRGGWIVVFDWVAWKAEAERLIAAGGIEGADVEDLRRLLTTIVRSNRFTEGQIAWAFEAGVMVRILRRLREL